MTLRFQLDQAACFRRGVDAPKSIVTIHVRPSEIQDETRALIADRMVNGIDVCYFNTAPPKLIVAESHDLDGLIAAVKADAKKV